MEKPRQSTSDFLSELPCDLPCVSAAASPSTLRLTINGDKRVLSKANDQPMSVADLLNELGYSGAHFAVALNMRFVPRGQHATTQICEGDAIEIVAPMQGG